GYSAAEAIGMSIERLVPATLLPRHRAGIAAFATSGRGSTIESGRVLDVTALTKDGHEVPVELSLTSLDDGPAQRTLVMAIVREATERRLAAQEAVRSMREQAARLEAEVAQRRFALLAEASALLAASLDYELALSGVARLAVPILGDWCNVYLDNVADGDDRL